MTDVIKPIFIIGTGRCGSTVFHQILADHPQIAWLSGLCNHIPGCAVFNKFLLYASDVPGLGRAVKKYFPPGETTLFWEYLAHGFSTSFRDLRADDVFPRVRERVRNEMAKHLTRRHNRQLHKLTGWPKMEFLLNIFPDALFIHIYRDGRAVASSFVEQQWWRGWLGSNAWRWGPLPVNYQREWERGNQSFILLAAIQWKVLMDAFKKAKKKVPAHSLLELKYEDLIRDPKTTLNKVLAFCQLDKNKKFEKILDSLRLDDYNEKWKKNLTVQQRQIVEKSLHKHLKYYGYL
jgi:hypothetical protein